MWPDAPFDRTPAQSFVKGRTPRPRAQIGAADAQVLVRLTDGSVMTIDHGACFETTATFSEPTPVVTSIPGVAPDLGKDLLSVEDALKRIERVTDDDLIEASAQVPLGVPWRSPVTRRMEIAEWLAHRRDCLRGVMEKWLTP